MTPSGMSSLEQLPQQCPSATASGRYCTKSSLRTIRGPFLQITALPQFRTLSFSEDYSSWGIWTSHTSNKQKEGYVTWMCVPFIMLHSLNRNMIEPRRCRALILQRCMLLLKTVSSSIRHGHVSESV